MAIVDSKEKMLGINELIQDAYENDPDPEFPLELTYARFAQEATMPNSYFLRYGNTVFIIHGDIKRAGLGTIRTLIADTDENLIQATAQFVKDAYEEGYYYLQSMDADPKFAKALGIVRDNTPHQGLKLKAVRNQENGGIKLDIILGDPNGTQLKAPKPMNFQPPKNAQDAAARVTNQTSDASQEMGMDSGQMPPIQQPMAKPPMGGLSQLQNKLTEGEV